MPDANAHPRPRRNRRASRVNTALDTPVVAATGGALARRAQRPATEAAASALLLYASVLEHVPHGLCLADAQGRVMLANQHYRDIWRLPAHLGQPGDAVVELEAARCGAQAAPPSSEGHARWATVDGRLIEVRLTALPDGHTLALHEDATARRDAEQQAVHDARHDPLTGLANALQLAETLAQRLPGTQRGEEMALLHVNLDRFKAVNEALGHRAGDQLLRQVAQRVQHGARGSDLVARLSGDEFAVLQCGARQPGASTVLARRLIDALARPFDVEGQQAYIGASVGVAVAPFDGDSAEALQRNADLALQRAKADGRGVLRYFEPGMDARMQTRRQLELDLRDAVARGEFELAFQPQVAVPTGRVAGVEALLRWKHPTRGPVSPADFIPLAEDTGLIVPIGLWVLKQACLQAMQWPADVRISVNVSAVQFKSRSLVLDVLHTLEETGLPPQRLELEITETLLLTDTDHALSVLHDLRQRGVLVAMDDFGTGYSSLSYLRRFPFDRLKIDRSFVNGVERGGDALAIVEAMQGLSHRLGMAVTVEGVETAAQLEALRNAGCTEVQGYYYSRPRPAGDIAALVRDGLHPELLPPSKPQP